MLSTTSPKMKLKQRHQTLEDETISTLNKGTYIENLSGGFYYSPSNAKNRSYLNYQRIYLNCLEGLVQT